MTLDNISEGIWVIKGFLSPEACQKHILESREIGFEKATVNLPSGAEIVEEIRNNTRVTTTDHKLAEKLWTKLQGLCPSVNGQEAIGFNELMRYYKYEVGERFNFHRDGTVRLEGRTSHLSALIYLNGNFTGGETEFENTIITPEEGDLLLFKHRLIHKGKAVTSGSKYVLRSDIFYPK